MEPFEFEYTGALADSVGVENGLRREELRLLLDQGRVLGAELLNGLQNGRLGFLALPDARAERDAIRQCAAGRRGAFEAVLLLGIGGSALGAQALYEALRPLRAADAPALRVIDNTDPSTILRAMEGLAPATTCALVISKSGETLETLAALAIVEDWYKAASRPLARQMIVVTGAQGPLRAYASRNGLPTFDVPKNVGGRFSVLSVVGLLPAALLGYDIEALASGAREVRDNAFASAPEANPALLNAALHTGLLERRDRTISVFMPYASRLERYGEWWAQLWAESLGKIQGGKDERKRCGQTALRALGAKDQHSQLQLFLDGPRDKLLTLVGVKERESVLDLPDGFDYEELGVSFLKGKNLADVLDAQRTGTERALLEGGVPCLRLTLPRIDARAIGALIMFHELSTAYAALYLGVNAYDQPAVEVGKRKTIDLLRKR